MVEQVVVGIDVSKAKLDVATGGEQFTVSNDRPGIGELVRRLSRLAPSLVVLEQPANLNSWRSVSWLPPGCR